MILDVELIALLLYDCGIVRGVSSQTAFNQQIVQLSQSSHSDPRLTKLHAHTYRWIQHPCSNNGDYAGAVVHMYNAPGTTLFAVSKSDPTSVQRVPAVVNLQFLADMGRMSGEWR